MKKVLLYSGGLDSTTLLHHLVAKGDEVVAVWCNYGQKSKDKELIAAKFFTNKLNCKLIEINIEDVYKYSNNCLLSGRGEVTQIVKTGNHTEFKHADTELIFRNTMLASVVITVATSLFPKESIEVNLGLIKTPYKDCSCEYVLALNNLTKLCTAGKVKIKAPFVEKGKDWVYKQAKKLNVEIDKAWSCYLGGETPCGVCPACIDRKIIEGFYANNKRTF